MIDRGPNYPCTDEKVSTDKTYPMCLRWRNEQHVSLDSLLVRF